MFRTTDDFATFGLAMMTRKQHNLDVDSSIALALLRCLSFSSTSFSAVFLRSLAESRIKPASTPVVFSICVVTKSAQCTIAAHVLSR